MPPAIIAAGVMAAGSIGGALLSSHSQNQATTQAAQTEQQATDAQLQLGRESLAQQNALAQQSIGLGTNIYNSNYDLLSPYVSRGNVAGDAYNALLGLPTAPVMQSPLHSTTPPGGTPPAAPPPVAGSPPPVPSPGIPPSSAQPPVPGGNIPHLPANSSMAATNALAPATNQVESQTAVPSQHPGLDRANAGRAARGLPPLGHPNTPAGTTTAQGSTPAGAPAPASTPQQSAFNTFANSAGMQFQLKQGENAIQNNYAAHGALNSGAAMKSLNDYAQQTALNNYFMPYMGMLGGQQATGAQAASAVAGVGSSFGNSVAGINSNLGSNSAAINGQMAGYIGNGADAAANAALARGAANGQMWNTIGSSFGNLAGSAIGSFGSSVPYDYPALANSGIYAGTGAGSLFG